LAIVESPIVYTVINFEEVQPANRINNKKPNAPIFFIISPSLYGNMAPKRITGKNSVNLSIAPCSENRYNHDALTSIISLVLYGF